MRSHPHTNTIIKISGAFLALFFVHLSHASAWSRIECKWTEEKVDLTPLLNDERFTLVGEPPKSIPIPKYTVYSTSRKEFKKFKESEEVTNSRQITQGSDLLVPLKDRINPAKNKNYEEYHSSTAYFIKVSENEGIWYLKDEGSNFEIGRIAHILERTLKRDIPMNHYKLNYVIYRDKSNGRILFWIK